MKLAFLSSVAAFMLLTAAAHAEPQQNVTVTCSRWGNTASGVPVPLYTLQDKELVVRITAYGARIVSIYAPDRAGNMQDIVLGYDDLAHYLQDKSYFGAIVGRYANRLARGRFTIYGKTYQVPVNNGVNALHGGPAGFSSKLWSAKKVPNGVEMSLVSPDGDMGFPGTLTVQVRYTLHGNSLRLDYTASTTKPTVINLSNHSYFNLAGNGKGTILNDLLTIPADRYTPIDAGSIPIGTLASVTGTPFDFRKPTAIGARIDQRNQQLTFPGGYDHNFVLDGTAHRGLHLAARVEDPASGRVLTIRSDQPGVQFYSGNFLAGRFAGKHGVLYGKHAAFALETQHFPDSPNHPDFPSTLLLPGHTFRSTTVYAFSVMHEKVHEAASSSD